MGMFINVKLSDYGISQWSSLIGLTAVKGTAGYQAPEVSQRNTRYDSKVHSFCRHLFMKLMIILKRLYLLASR